MREHIPQPIASATAPSGNSAGPAPWTRLALAPITAALEQPHPLDPATPRRCWRVWQDAVLIDPEPRPQHPAALQALRAEVPKAGDNGVRRPLRWRHPVGIDVAPLRAGIAAWPHDAEVQRRASAAAKHNRRATRQR